MENWDLMPGVESPEDMTAEMVVEHVGSAVSDSWRGAVGRFESAPLQMWTTFYPGAKQDEFGMVTGGWPGSRGTGGESTDWRVTVTQAFASGELVGDDHGWVKPVSWMNQDPDAKPSWDTEQAIRYWEEVKGAKHSEDGW